MNVIYCTESTYRAHIDSLNVNTFIVHVRGAGEDVILLGDNQIDVVKFRFRKGRKAIRGC